MAGTRSGGFKAAQTNYSRHGRDFYRNIGRLGGTHGTTGGFAYDPKKAKIAGAKGGANGHRFPILDANNALDIEHQDALSRVILIAYVMRILDKGIKEMSPKVIADINKKCSNNRWNKVFSCKHINTVDLKAVFTHLMESTEDERTRDMYGSLRKSFKDESGMNYFTTSKYDIELARKSYHIVKSTI